MITIHIRPQSGKYAIVLLDPHSDQEDTIANQFASKADAEAFVTEHIGQIVESNRHPIGGTLHSVKCENPLNFLYN